MSWLLSWFRRPRRVVDITQAWQHRLYVENNYWATGPNRRR